MIFGIDWPSGFREEDDDGSVSSMLSGLETKSLGLNTLGTT